MSFADWALGRRASPENPSTSLSNPAEWFADWASGGGKAASGIAVSPDTAMRCAAVYACVRVLSESIASLPVHVYERLDGNGRQRADGHPLYEILRYQPNGVDTAFNFFETGQAHLSLRGNFYGKIEHNGAGKVRSITPLSPMSVTPKLDGDVLTYHLDEGKTRDTLLPFEVLHVRGLGFKGPEGLSPIGLAREAVGLALSAEEYGARFFGNGSRPGGVIEAPEEYGEEAFKRLKASWEATHQGPENAHKVAILEEGAKWHQIGIAPEEAQFLESRKFQVQEIARIFRVPPHMLADLDRATFSNIEHQSLEFVMHTLRPWLVRWEQELNRKLISSRNRRRFFIEFKIDGLLRGDIESRSKYYAQAINWGWMSPNEVRSLENMNPRDDGDVYLQPQNMAPSGSETKGAAA